MAYVLGIVCGCVLCLEWCVINLKKELRTNIIMCKKNTGAIQNLCPHKRYYYRTEEIPIFYKDTKQIIQYKLIYIKHCLDCHYEEVMEDKDIKKEKSNG